MDARSLRRQLLLSSAMLVGALSAYGRRAYAACVNVGAPNFECSGTTNTTQTINAANAHVITLATPPFVLTTGVSTTALTIIGDGALSYTDEYFSKITAGTNGTGLSIGSLGTGTDSITVKTNGAIKGGSFGISARNTVGGGSVIITANGDVTGTNSRGILAQNFGTDLMVTTGGNVIGSTYGIFAFNASGSTGATSVTANGNVTATSGRGIFAGNSAGGTGVTVTTGSGTTVTGRNYGISAENNGSGILAVTTNGVVSGNTGIDARNYGSQALNITANGDVNGTTSFGINAQNGGYFDQPHGSDLTVITGEGTTVTGGFIGLRAFNYGSGALTIEVSGDVKANGTVFPLPTAITAYNKGYNLTISTKARATVYGKGTGISAINYNGALTVTANGNVTGRDAYGIDARNSGTTLSVVTGPDTAVTGGKFGIRAGWSGSGPLAITVNGDVTGGTEDGIFTCQLTNSFFFTCGGTGGDPVTITVGSASTVTSNGAGANDFAIDIADVAGEVTVAGTLNGGVGGAIQFNQGAALNDRLELQPGAVVNGKVLAGPGTDSFVLGGEGEASFDVGTIGAGLQYQSFEIFSKEDGSHWTLVGTNSGIPAFAVNGGLLSVNGSMPRTAFTVNGGALGGSGMIGGLTVASGGIVAPGNSIGTLNVNGAFTLSAGAIYEVETNAAGQGDKVVVAGTVNLSGAILRVLAENGDYKRSTSYLVVDNNGADAVQGTFAKVTTNLAFLDPFVSYTAGTGNDVVLTLVRNDVSLEEIAVTENEEEAAIGLGPCDPNDVLCLALLNLTAREAQQALNALSGEVHATVPGVLADESRYVREAVLGRLIQASYTGNAGQQVASLGASGPQVASLDSSAMTLGSDNEAMSLGSPAPAYAAPDYGPGLAFWTNAFGAWGDFDGNKNASSASRDLGGLVSGMDARVSGTWRLGIAAGYSQSNISVDSLHSSADAESFHLAGYAGGAVGPLALRTGGAWAWNDIDTSRAVVFPGFFEREKTSYDADTGQIFGEVAYPLAMGDLAVEPFAGIAGVKVDTDSFKEHGKFAALTSSGFDENVSYSTLGLRAAATMQWSGAVITPHVSVAWQHAFDDVTPEATLVFASTGIGFEVTGAPLAENSALIEAGLDLNLTPTMTLGASYSGQIASGLTDNAVKGRFTWLF